ncbi:hypothetical protein [Streptomyces sp. I05A-00742]|uniref:hypothetical protein n=1 Tax=Streptomyces sp. I05A-00742 TaxID=2732853 RepID=UPI001488F5FB|nr:hypothetical protein [Streptomyces sp. I05A-00742]
MTSNTPSEKESAAGPAGDGNPNLVKDGGFRAAPRFNSDECGFSRALAAGGDNTRLVYWDYGGSGNANGQPGGNPGDYIDVTNHEYSFAQSDAEDKVDSSNAIDLVGRGNGRHGYVGQHLSGLITGAQYDVTFWASSPWYNEDPHYTTMYYSVSDGTVRDGGKPLDNDYVVIPQARRDPIPGGSWRRQWKQYQKSFIAQSPDAYLSFADDTGDGYWTGTMLACVSVRLSAPVHDYRISGTDPASSADAPLSAPKDTPFDSFRVRFLDETNQPLFSQDVTLRLEPHSTGSHFSYGGQAPLTYPGKTDGDGWLTVPAGTLQAGPQEGPMQIYARLRGTDLHGQVDLRVGAATARFSVSPGGTPVTLTRHGETRYPGVQLRTDADGGVPPQKIRVTLPQGRGLRFVSEGGYQLTVMDAHFGTTAYSGTLQPDEQSLVFDGVDLALRAKGATSTAWVAVKALPDAPAPADTALTFHVGNQTSASTLIQVRAG